MSNMAKNLQDTGDISFPIKALTLAQAAVEAVETQFKELEKQMLETFLPRTVEVILAHEAECRDLLKKKQPKGYTELPEKIGQILWSHPGRMGAMKIERLFFDLGFDDKEADLLATKVYQYSRYTFSLVNSLRMRRSAVQAIRDAIEPAKMQERYLDRTESWADKYAEWIDHSMKLGIEPIDNDLHLDLWLGHVETFISTISYARSWERDRKIQNEDPNRIAKSNSMSRVMATAFTRRFGQFLRTEFGLLSKIPRYKSKEVTFEKEIKQYKKKFDADDAQILEHMQADYNLRQNRIKVASTSSDRKLSNKSTSYFEKYISNVLQIDDREVLIKNSSEKVSPELIDQMYKLFIAQLTINSNQAKFVGKSTRDNQTLIVELANPTKSDAPKLKKLLKALFD